MAKVTTGTGDTGYTGLLGDQRVPKYDPRPDTFGTVDEATSALGLARAMTQDPKVKQIIYQIQQELYLLMGELATPPENYEKMGLRMTAEHVKRLEQVEEQLKQEVEIPQGPVGLLDVREYRGNRQRDKKQATKRSRGEKHAHRHQDV